MPADNLRKASLRRIINTNITTIMYMTICELTLGTDKTIKLECVASVRKMSRLVYFVNFEAFALEHRPPNDKSSLLKRLCSKIALSSSSSSSSSSSYSSSESPAECRKRRMLEWRDSLAFRRLDDMGMLCSWQDILREGDFTSVDSTNALHLKNSTLFVRIEGFFMLARAMLNEEEYARMMISMMNVMTNLQQRHCNVELNDQLAELKATTRHLDDMLLKMHAENARLHRQLRLCKDVFLKLPPKNTATHKNLCKNV